MSIEQALADNTAALKALTAALGASHPQHTAPSVIPAPSVPSSAAVPPPPIAPVATLDTSPPPTSVFGQLALPGVPLAPPAAALTASHVPAGSVPTPAGQHPLAAMIPAHLVAPGAAAQAGQPAVAPNAAASPSSLDKNGIPWDGRIHASSKALVADGSWRAKRNVDPALVATVTAELRGAQAAPPGHGLSGQPWPFATSEADIRPLAGFAGMMDKLPGLMVAGTITTDMVAAACASVGVANLPALATREDLVPQVAAALGVTL